MGNGAIVTEATNALVARSGKVEGRIPCMERVQTSPGIPVGAIAKTLWGTFAHRPERANLMSFAATQVLSATVPHSAGGLRPELSRSRKCQHLSGSIALSSSSGEPWMD